MYIILVVLSFIVGGCLGYVLAFHNIEVKKEKDVNISVKMSEKVTDSVSKRWTEEDLYALIEAQDDFHQKEVVEPLNDTEDLLSTVSDLLSGDISMEDIETMEGDD